MRLKLAATDRRPDLLKNSYRATLDLFEFIHAGILTTVQDLGRFGYQRYGVPVSGAMDCFSFKVANILAGNDKNLASLEMTLAGPTLRVINPCTIAITGADMNPTLNGEKVDLWASQSLKTGDVLAFSSAEHGCRAYLAVSGGIQATEVLGSRSTYLRGGFGGYRGRAHQEGRCPARDFIGLKDTNKVCPSRVHTELPDKLDDKSRSWASRGFFHR